MILSSRNKKRILIFLIIPLLAIVPLISDDIVIKSIAIAILVVYVAFIIFLRDSVRIKNMLENEPSDSFIDDDLIDTETKGYDTDLGETVKIVSKKKMLKL